MARQTSSPGSGWHSGGRQSRLSRDRQSEGRNRESSRIRRRAKSDHARLNPSREVRVLSLVQYCPPMTENAKKERLFSALVQGSIPVIIGQDGCALTYNLNWVSGADGESRTPYETRGHSLRLRYQGFDTSHRLVRWYVGADWSSWQFP